MDYSTLFIPFLGFFVWEYVALLYERSRNKSTGTKENDKDVPYFFRIKPSYGLTILNQCLIQVFTQIGKFFGYLHGKVLNFLKYVWNEIDELLEALVADFCVVCNNLFVPALEICGAPFYVVKGYFTGLATTLRKISVMNYVVLGLSGVYGFVCLAYVGCTYGAIDCKFLNCMLTF